MSDLKQLIEEYNDMINQYGINISTLSTTIDVNLNNVVVKDIYYKQCYKVPKNIENSRESLK